MKGVYAMRNHSCCRLAYVYHIYFFFFFLDITFMCVYALCGHVFVARIHAKDMEE